MEVGRHGCTFSCAEVVAANLLAGSWSLTFLVFNMFNTYIIQAVIGATHAH